MPGRNDKALHDLKSRFGERIKTVKLTGNEEDDRQRMQQAAPDKIDCVLNILPPEADPTAVRAAIMTVRPDKSALLALI